MLLCLSSRLISYYAVSLAPDILFYDISTKAICEALTPSSSIIYVPASVSSVLQGVRHDVKPSYCMSCHKALASAHGPFWSTIMILNASRRHYVVLQGCSVNISSSCYQYYWSIEGGMPSSLFIVKGQWDVFSFARHSGVFIGIDHLRNTLTMLLSAISVEAIGTALTPSSSII